ncbi:SARS2 [Cordylochernes scorpioides]|uniref:serine--tRNA ligase n=1 Tax=Cordylochernes scorpioides TaxID=51811 RepID=A0ABY6LMC5_9ARAC|nr:SARS2 [Cordylochernes scorpioides]
MKTLICINQILKLNHFRRHSLSILKRQISTHFTLNEPHLNYLLDTNNKEIIEKNIHIRKSNGSLEKLYSLNEELQNINTTKCDPQQIEMLKSQVKDEANEIPNQTHPDILHYQEPRLVKYVGNKKESTHKHYNFVKLAERWDLIRTQNLGLISSSRTYYLRKDLARLEMALIRYAIDFLKAKKFTPISVPDILNIDVLRQCGIPNYHLKHQTGSITQWQADLAPKEMVASDMRNRRHVQLLLTWSTNAAYSVYKLSPEWPGDGQQYCLSGTSEMALAAYLAGRVLPEDSLPRRLVACSRCFRQEEAEGKQGQNLYRFTTALWCRVKQFYKVEMFAACAAHQSDSLLEEFVELQTELFSSLGLHFQILDMPPSDFNNATYRKYDIEAWMPGMEKYGEISSTSNCTDYQSQRLNIRYKEEDGSERFIHTVNGTACAIPRMLISLVETHQNANHTISLPKPLWPYLQGQQTIPLNKKDFQKNQWILMKYL